MFRRFVLAASPAQGVRESSVESSENRCQSCLAHCLAPRRSLYAEMFVRKYRHTCLQLRRDLCPRLNPALCLDLNRDLCPDLNLNLNLNLGPPLLQTLFRRLFAALLGSLFDSMLV